MSIIANALFQVVLHVRTRIKGNFERAVSTPIYNHTITNLHMVNYIPFNLFVVVYLKDKPLCKSYLQQPDDFYISLI